MIPLRDAVRSRTFPFVNYLFIALNIGVFLFEYSLKGFSNDFVSRFGLTPALWLDDVRAMHVHAAIPLFTSMFMHGGWMHLLGNMLFLFIFGDNVEDAFGHFRYLIFYVLVGFAAAFTQIYFNAASEIPMVGASGAIAGILGAYLFLYPRAKIKTFVPLIFIFFKIIDLPAYLFLGIWFILQVISGIMGLGIAGDAGGVAWWAHIGGFVAGAISFSFFRK